MPQPVPVGPSVVYLAGAPPGVSDDSASIRARRGYWWVDRSGPDLWVCIDPAEGAAVWRQVVDAAYVDTLASALGAHLNNLNNPHGVTAAQVGADPVGSAGSAEANAKSYTDGAINSLGSASRRQVGTQQLELPRNTELASGGFAPYEPLSLTPVLPAGGYTVTADDAGKVIWSAGHDITLPNSSAPGVGAGWRVWIKNTHGSASLTIARAGVDTLDGGASLTLAAGTSILIVRRAAGEYGSL